MTTTEPRVEAIAEAGVGLTEELVDTPWNGHAREASSAGIGRMMRAMPGFTRFAIGLAWRCSRSATIVVLGLQAISAATTVFGLLGVAQVLTKILTSGQIGDRLVAALPTLAVVAASYAIGGLAASGVGAAEARLSPGVRRLAEDDLVATVADIELLSFDDPTFHDALLRARDRGVHSVDMALVQLVALAGTVVSILGITTALGALNPMLLPVLAVSVLPTAWATMRSARLGYATFLRTMAARRRLRRISDLITGRESAAAVRAYTAQQFLLAEYRGLARPLERIEVRLGWSQARIHAVGQTLSGLGMGLAYGMLFWLVMSGRVPVSTAGAAMIALQTGRGALTRAALVLNLLYEQGLYVRDFGQFLNDARKRRRPLGRPPAPVQPQLVELRDVTFRYPEAAIDALQCVSFTIRRGQVLALVGENGSGKSTLAKLLAGLYQPDSGAIAWDGVDLATVDSETVRARVALIPQEATHWPLTASQYVTIGRSGPSGRDHPRLAEAALASGAATVVAELPASWETLLSKEFKGGAELSVGQWQRLAVARALYRDAPLLICDEPTAPLDPRAEAQVYDTLRELAGGRTTVLITHRLASVRSADQIVVLRKGKVIECGTHDELIAVGGHYAELYVLQAGPYQV